jgi:hypothetical protein
MEEELEDRKILEESVGTLQEDKAALAAAEHERDDNSASFRERKSPRDGSSVGSETLFYRRRRTSKLKKLFVNETEDLDVKFKSLQAERQKRL